MTRVILTLLFYVILTPVSLLSKLTGKVYLVMRPDKDQQSYWLDVEDSDDPGHYDNQY